jgi:hypothetical protein
MERYKSKVSRSRVAVGESALSEEAEAEEEAEEEALGLRQRIRYECIDSVVTHCLLSLGGVGADLLSDAAAANACSLLRAAKALGAVTELVARGSARSTTIGIAPFRCVANHCAVRCNESCTTPAPPSHAVACTAAQLSSSNRTKRRRASLITRRNTLFLLICSSTERQITTSVQ